MTSDQSWNTLALVKRWSSAFSDVTRWTGTGARISPTRHFCVRRERGGPRDRFAEKPTSRGGTDVDDQPPTFPDHRGRRRRHPGRGRFAGAGQQRCVCGSSGDPSARRCGGGGPERGARGGGVRVERAFKLPAAAATRAGQVGPSPGAVLEMPVVQAWLRLGSASCRGLPRYA